MAPISYGQSNIPAPSFLDMFGKGFGESLGKSIPDVVEQFKKKKAMDELQQTLLSNPDTKEEVSTPLFQAAMAMKDPSIYIQGKLAGRDKKEEYTPEEFGITGLPETIKAQDQSKADIAYQQSPEYKALGLPSARLGNIAYYQNPLLKRKLSMDALLKLREIQSKAIKPVGVDPVTKQTIYQGAEGLAYANGYPYSGGQLQPLTLPKPGAVTETGLAYAAVNAASEDEREKAQKALDKLQEEKTKVGTDREAIALADYNKPFAQLTPAQRFLVNDKVEKGKEKTAEAKSRGWATYRMYSVFDSAEGNRPVMKSGYDLAQADKNEPGRYMPTAAGAKALSQTNLIEDIRSNIEGTRKTVNAMAQSDFNDWFKAKIALIMNDDAPSSVLNSVLKSEAAGSLNENQVNYLTRVTQLTENAMSMRSVLGAGQSSLDLRKAIKMTILGPSTPNAKFALRQLELFETTLDQLERGIPAVQLRDIGKERGKEPAGKGKKMNLEDYLKLHEGK